MGAQPKLEGAGRVRHDNDGSARRSGTMAKVGSRGPLADNCEEHDKLRDWLAKLKTDEPAALSAALVGMRTMLQRHFAGEEGRGGLFELVGERRGQDRVVSRLRAEHQEMIQRIEALERQLTTAEYDLDGRLGRGCLELVELIAKHERVESGLLQDLLLTDLGEG